jgi:hypothetical protein
LLFILLQLLFIFSYIQHLVLDNHLVEFGDARQGVYFAGCVMRTKRDFMTVPREFDINPEFPRGKNLLLLQHSALGFPTKWHIA